MDQIKLLLETTGLSADDLIRQLSQYKASECNKISEVNKERRSVEADKNAVIIVDSDDECSNEVVSILDDEEVADNCQAAVDVSRTIVKTEVGDLGADADTNTRLFENTKFESFLKTIKVENDTNAVLKTIKVEKDIDGVGNDTDQILQSTIQSDIIVKIEKDSEDAPNLNSNLASEEQLCGNVSSTNEAPQNNLQTDVSSKSSSAAKEGSEKKLSTDSHSTVNTKECHEKNVTTTLDKDNNNADIGEVSENVLSTKEAPHNNLKTDVSSKTTVDAKEGPEKNLTTIGVYQSTLDIKECHEKNVTTTLNCDNNDPDIDEASENVLCTKEAPQNNLKTDESNKTTFASIEGSENTLTTTCQNTSDTKESHEKNLSAVTSATVCDSDPDINEVCKNNSNIASESNLESDALVSAKFPEKNLTSNKTEVFKIIFNNDNKDNFDLERVSEKTLTDKTLTSILEDFEENIEVFEDTVTPQEVLKSSEIVGVLQNNSVVCNKEDSHVKDVQNVLKVKNSEDTVEVTNSGDTLVVNDSENTLKVNDSKDESYRICKSLKVKAASVGLENDTEETLEIKDSGYTLDVSNSEDTSEFKTASGVVLENEAVIKNVSNVGNKKEFHVKNALEVKSTEETLEVKDSGHTSEVALEVGLENKGELQNGQDSILNTLEVAKSNSNSDKEDLNPLAVTNKVDFHVKDTSENNFKPKTITGNDSKGKVFKKTENSEDIVGLVKYTLNPNEDAYTNILEIIQASKNNLDTEEMLEKTLNSLKSVSFRNDTKKVDLHIGDKPENDLKPKTITGNNSKTEVSKNTKDSEDIETLGLLKYTLKPNEDAYTNILEIIEASKNNLDTEEMLEKTLNSLKSLGVLQPILESPEKSVTNEAPEENIENKLGSNMSMDKLEPTPEVEEKSTTNDLETHISKKMVEKKSKLHPQKSVEKSKNTLDTSSMFKGIKKPDKKFKKLVCEVNWERVLESTSDSEVNLKMSMVLNETPKSDNSDIKKVTPHIDEASKNNLEVSQTPLETDENNLETELMLETDTVLNKLEMDGIDQIVTEKGDIANANNQTFEKTNVSSSENIFKKSDQAVRIKEVKKNTTSQEDLKKTALDAESPSISQEEVKKNASHEEEFKNHSKNNDEVPDGNFSGVMTKFKNEEVVDDKSIGFKKRIITGEVIDENTRGFKKKINNEEAVEDNSNRIKDISTNLEAIEESSVEGFNLKTGGELTEKSTLVEEIMKSSKLIEEITNTIDRNSNPNEDNSMLIEENLNLIEQNSSCAEEFEKLVENKYTKTEESEKNFLKNFFDADNTHKKDVDEDSNKIVIEEDSKQKVLVEDEFTLAFEEEILVEESSNKKVLAEEDSNKKVLAEEDSNKNVHAEDDSDKKVLTEEDSNKKDLDVENSNKKDLDVEIPTKMVSNEENSNKSNKFVESCNPLNKLKNKSSSHDLTDGTTNNVKGLKKKSILNNCVDLTEENYDNDDGLKEQINTLEELDKKSDKTNEFEGKATDEDQFENQSEERISNKINSVETMDIGLGESKINVRKICGDKFRSNLKTVKGLKNKSIKEKNIKNTINCVDLTEEQEAEELKSISTSAEELMLKSTSEEELKSKSSTAPPLMSKSSPIEDFKSKSSTAEELISKPTSGEELKSKSDMAQLNCNSEDLKGLKFRKISEIEDLTEEHINQRVKSRKTSNMFDQLKNFNRHIIEGINSSEDLISRLDNLKKKAINLGEVGSDNSLKKKVVNIGKLKRNDFKKKADNSGELKKIIIIENVSAESTVSGSTKKGTYTVDELKKKLIAVDEFKKKAKLIKKHQEDSSGDLKKKSIKAVGHKIDDELMGKLKKNIINVEKSKLKTNNDIDEQDATKVNTVLKSQKKTGLADEQLLDSHIEDLTEDTSEDVIKNKINTKPDKNQSTPKNDERLTKLFKITPKSGESFARKISSIVSSLRLSTKDPEIVKNQENSSTDNKSNQKMVKIIIKSLSGKSINIKQASLNPQSDDDKDSTPKSAEEENGSPKIAVDLKNGTPPNNQNGLKQNKGRLPIVALLHKRLLDSQNATPEIIELDDDKCEEVKKQPLYGCIRKNENKDKHSRQRKPPWLLDADPKVTESSDVREEIFNQLDMLKRKKDPLVDIKNIPVSPPKLLSINKKRRSDSSIGLDLIKIVDVRGGTDNNLEVINKELECDAITVTKTKDFKKIKGWKHKKLLVSPTSVPPVKKVTVVDDGEPVAGCSYIDYDKKEVVATEESGCVFASDNLDGFLDEQKALNISYDVPNLESSNHSSIDPMDDRVLIKEDGPKEVVLSDNKRRFTMAQSEDAVCIAPSNVKTNPYKPRTLAEKRKMLEGEAEKPRKVNRMDTKSVFSIVHYRNKRLKVVTKVERDVHIVSRNKMKRDFKYIPVKPRLKHKKLVPKVMEDEVKKVQKPSIYATPKASGVFYKPGPLSKKALLQLNELSKWRTVIKPMPKVFVQIKPELGKVVHPRARQFMDFDTFEISNTRIEFALSAVVGSTSDRKFKFEVPFQFNQGTIMLRQKIPQVDTKPKLEAEVVKVDVAKVEDVETTLKNVVSDLITCLENREIDGDIIKMDEPRPVEVVEKVVKKRGRGTSAEIIKGTCRKTNMELKRLSVKVIEVNIEDEKETINCSKSFCKFGCVCKSLNNITLPPDHCSNINCIFTCTCGYEKNKRDSLRVSLPAGTDVLSARTVSRLQIEAKRNLAPVEKQFTQTVIHANNQTIVVGDSTDRKRRPLKYPKRYEDYTEIHPEEDDEDVPILKILEAKEEELPDEEEEVAIVPCVVELNVLDIDHILPYCLEHNLYRCHCNFLADYTKRAQRASEHDEVIKAKRLKEIALKPQSKPPSPAVTDSGVPIKRKYVKKKNMSLTGAKVPEPESSAIKIKIKPLPVPVLSPPAEITPTTSNSDILSCDDDLLQPLGVGTVEGNKPSRRKQQLQTREEIDEKRNRETSMTTIKARRQEIAEKRAEKKEKKRQKYNRSVVDTAKLIERNKLIFGGIQKGVYTPTGAICQKFSRLLGESEQSDPTFKLIQWSSLMERYTNKKIQVWFNEVTNKTKFIITDSEPKSVSKYKNVASLENTPIQDLKLDFVRWILHRQVPGGKHGDSILVILKLSKFFWEICGICAKNKANTAEQPAETTPPPIPPIENITDVVSKTQEFINSANDKYKTVQQVVFSNGDFTPKTLIQSSSSTHDIIEASLPSVQTDFKWRVLKVNSNFSILSFNRNEFRIKCSDIITVMKVSQRYGRTIVINTDDISVNYSHKLFGIYITHNHTDRIFIGPYFSYEDHDIETLRFVNNVLINTEIFNTMRGETTEDSTGVWYKQVPMLQVAKLPPNSTPIPTLPTLTSVIDLTDVPEEEPKSIFPKKRAKKRKSDLVTPVVVKSPRSLLKVNQPTAPPPPPPPRVPPTTLRDAVSSEARLETRLLQMLNEQKLHIPKGCKPICFKMNFHPGLILGWTTQNAKQVVVYWPGEAAVSSRAFTGTDAAIKWLQMELTATFILIPAEFTIRVKLLTTEALDEALTEYTFPHKYFTDSFVVGDFGILRMADVVHHFAVKRGTATEKKPVRTNLSIDHDKFIKLFIESNGIDESRFMDSIREQITNELLKSNKLSNVKLGLEKKKMELLIRHVGMIKEADKATQDRMKTEFMNNWSSKRTTTPPPQEPVATQPPIISEEIICLDSDEEQQPEEPAQTETPTEEMEITDSSSSSSLLLTVNGQLQSPVVPQINGGFTKIVAPSQETATSNGLKPKPIEKLSKQNPKLKLKKALKRKPVDKKKEKIEHIDLSHMSNAVIKSMLGANFVGNKVTLTQAQLNRLKELSAVKNAKSQKNK